MVYRLLFLFVAEDRDLLLDPAAIRRPRERYERLLRNRPAAPAGRAQRGTQHVDLYRVLALIMEKLGSDEGCPELGLPALGSFLWSREAVADLAGCDLANADLLDAIRALAVTTTATRGARSTTRTWARRSSAASTNRCSSFIPS